MTRSHLMKSSSRLLYLSLFLTSSFSVSASPLLFTEYVEGTGFNKALEIMNVSGSPVDLDAFRIEMVQKSNSGNTPINLGSLSGTLAPNEMVVLVKDHDDSDINLHESIKLHAMAGLDSNGDDTVFLKRGTETIDTIGTLGTENSAPYIKDMTLERISTSVATSGEYVPSEWLQKATDTFSGLGARSGEFSASAYECPDSGYTHIAEIQGDGHVSPMVNDDMVSEEALTVRGIVSAITNDIMEGMFIRAEQPDDDPMTSDGIFVKTGFDPEGVVEEGDIVCLAAKVKEAEQMTMLDLSESPSKMEVIGSTDKPAPILLAAPSNESLHDSLERLEGIRIRLNRDSSMMVTRSFGYDYKVKRNNIRLSPRTVLFEPTQLYVAGTAEQTALTEKHRKNNIYVESYKPIRFERPSFMKDFDADINHLRVGDQITNLEGVVVADNDGMRLIPMNVISTDDIIRNNPRIDELDDPSDQQLRVMALNMFNYFNDSVGGDPSVAAVNYGSSDQNEFRLQREKLLRAAKNSKADVMVLTKISNNGYKGGSALEDFINELNFLLPPEDSFAFVRPELEDLHEGKYLGTTPHQVAIIYKSSKVQPVGKAKVIPLPEQIAAAGAFDSNPQSAPSPEFSVKQRASLAQRFNKNGHEIMLVGVHLKSKGSSCLEDWMNANSESPKTTPQGNCNNLRVSGALALREALANEKGGVLMLGDFNSYAKEDPILALTDWNPAQYTGKQIKTARYTQMPDEEVRSEALILSRGAGYMTPPYDPHLYGEFGRSPEQHQDKDEYLPFNYEFEGRMGALTHAIVSPELGSKIKKAGYWHINSPESPLFRYSGKYSGDIVKSEDQFASSRHDPLVVTFAMPAPPLPPVEGEPKKKSSGSIGVMLITLLFSLGCRRKFAS